MVKLEGAQQEKLFKEHTTLLRKWRLQLSERMGQIASVNGQPTAGAERFSTMVGFGTVVGTQIRFDGLLFLQPAEGAPALVDWLRSRGCSDFRYEFHTRQGREDDAGENEE